MTWVVQGLTQPAESDSGLWGLLQGTNIPAVIPADYPSEPFDYIIQGLWATDLPPDSIVLAAERAKSLLEQRLDRAADMSSLQDLFFNLFSLCAELNRPELLSDSLRAVYHDQEVLYETSGGQSPQLFHERVRGALRSALISNQIDDALIPCWEKMYSGETNSYLGGNHYTGFQGVLYLPVNPTDGYAKNLPHIASAMAAYAQYLTNHPDRRFQFRNLIDDVETAYLGVDSFDWIVAVDKARWPLWAILEMPKINIHIKEANNCDEFIVWHDIADVLRRLFPGHAAILSNYCTRTLTHIQIDRIARPVVEFLATKLDAKRLARPFSSESSIYAIVLDVLIEFDLVTKSRLFPEITRSLYELISPRIAKQRDKTLIGSKICSDEPFLSSESQFESAAALDLCAKRLEEAHEPILGRARSINFSHVQMAQMGCPEYCQ